MHTVRSDDSSAGSSSALRSVLIVSASAFAATLLPLLLFLRRCSPFAETSLFQPDAFYYLAVAKSSLRTSFYSFDGVYPTNGFHPVWEYLLYHAMRLNLLRPDQPFLTLHRLYIGNLLILSLAFALLAAFAAFHVRRGWLAFLAVCPGFLWFVVALTSPFYLANWSFLNGMESSVELLFLGVALLAFSVTAQTALRLPLAMLLFGLLVLSRLDDAFLLIPVLFLIWRSSIGIPRARLLTSLALPLLMVAAYLMYNRISVGVFMPTSGMTKAGLSIAENLKNALLLLKPGRWLQNPDASYSEVFMREFQMLAPMLVCAIFLAKRIRSHWGIMEALCVGVLLKGAYNFINVGTYHQGSWYFGSSIFIANLAIALLLNDALDRAEPAAVKASWLSPWSQALACAALVAVSFNIYANHFMSYGGGGVWQHSILAQSDTLRGMVRSQGSDRFIEMNDGELAYSTGLQAISGQGLVLDPAAAKALAHGHFFEIAADRGYHLLMASGLYKDLTDGVLQRRAQGSREGLFMISGAELDRFTLLPVAYDPVSNTRLYRITPIH